MKKSVINLCLLLLIFIYCITITGGVKSFLDFNKSSISSQENYISDKTSRLFFHSTQLDISIGSIKNIPLQNSKNKDLEFLTFCKKTNQLIEVEYSQYITLSKLFNIKLRKFDLIFPFDYFW